MKFCMKCGKELEGSAFCTKCGTRAGESEQENSQPINPHGTEVAVSQKSLKVGNKKLFIGILIGIPIVIAIVVAAIFIISNNDNSYNASNGPTVEEDSLANLTDALDGDTPPEHESTEQTNGDIIDFVGTIPISAGRTFSTAILADGNLWAWGGNGVAQIGGVTAEYVAYSPIIIMENVIEVSTSYSQIMAIQADNSLWAWDMMPSDDFAFRMDGYFPFEAIYPAKVMENVIAASTGWFDTVAIRSDESLWTWEGTASYLVRGTTELLLSPVKIMENVIAVSAYSGTTMAIRSDGSLWSWRADLRAGGMDGYDSYPVKIMENVVAVSAGEGHSMAVQSDGSLWAWGNNFFGQLGIGTTESPTSPVKIMENVVAVSAGEGHSMAVQSDGSLWAWGSNSSGQLGDGTNDNRLSPVKVMENVVAVSAGGFHTMAVQSDGSLWAWGANFYGQVGDGTSIDRPTPIRIMGEGSILTNSDLPEQSQNFEVDMLRINPIESLSQTIMDSRKLIRLTIHWEDNSHTIFERDNGSELWIMIGREGNIRIADPSFHVDGDALSIAFPTTTRHYYLYNDGTGVFDHDFTWWFEAHPFLSFNLTWGTNQTSNLQNAIAQYPLIAIRVFWNNNEFAYFYRNEDGSWIMRGRQGGLEHVIPGFGIVQNGTIMEISGLSAFYLNDGGSGTFENEAITWSFCYAAR